MNIKYLLGAIVTIPLLPLMYIQGKQIRKKIPSLPEAEGREGVSSISSKKRLSLITIGESTMAGVGVDTHKEGFTGMLAEDLSTKLNIQICWKVYAKSGYTAKDVLQKIIPKIDENKVDILIVGLGGNDAFRLNTPKKWKSHILNIINALKNKFENAIIVFINMPPIKEFTAFTPLMKFTLGNLVTLFGEELEKVIDDHKEVYFHSQCITLEDWINKMDSNAKPSDFFSDGVHPSKLTYQTWAKDISDFISNDQNIVKNLKLRV